LSQIGTFRSANGFLFDAALADAHIYEPRVVGVRAQPGNARAVAERLRHLGAERVIITAELADGFRRPPAMLPNALQIGLLQSGAGEPTAPLPELALNIVPLNEGLVARRFLLRVIDDRRDSTGRGTASLFSGGLVGLSPQAIMPVLEAEQASGGQLTPGSLEGLHALVAVRGGDDPARLLTSSLPGSPALGASGFQARVLQAILTGNVVVELRGVGRALFLVLASLVLAILLMLVPARHRTAGAALAGVVLLALGLSLVTIADLLLPLAELVLIAAALGVGAAFAEARNRKQRLVNLEDRVTRRLRQGELLQDSSRWAEFFAVAARLTGVESSLVVRERLDDTFVTLSTFGPLATKGAAGLVPSPDFQRADAVRPAPVEISEMAEWHGAMLVRLSSPGAVGVYWLFALPISSEERYAIVAAAARLAALTSEQISWGRQPGGNTDRLARSEGQLERAVTGIVDRYGELTRSLNSLQTATILFEGRGIPLIVNPSMERLMAQRGMQISRATPVDLAATLTGIETDAARSALGHLVRHGGQLRLGSEAEVDGRTYTLRVCGLGGALLFEAVDITEPERLARIKTELAVEIDAKIRNDLEAIGLALRLARDERLAPEKRDRALGLIGQAAERTRGTLDSLAHLVDTSALKESEAYPVNPRSTLAQVLAKLRPGADRGGVSLRVRQPTLSSLVLADPQLLEGTIEAMLQIIVSDSPHGSQAEVVLAEGEHETHLTIRGGFGLPSARFEASLSGESRNPPPPFRIIQRAMRQAPQWGAALAAQSDAGQGYQFDLRLRKI
jgi:hypothetical protein